ncbi:LysM domain-containing protein [Paenibacillus sp. NAIST15-1]|uniref:LysM peptidoglycan-binding domain-containing protein n=1 Tax=Paenibacillus sp. NAIST15-1 TaxID=1605994 RepID=UPI00086E8806|nr:LysM domain-containing protein [Paenibacillus sp. NAIST15-1]GAV15375.1 hypothetical protein PBN151_5354 [Paenibacillus sp. NAIST15-1]
MKIHIVKKGDTLYALAKKYGITLEELIAMNSQLANPNELDVGMKIKVPSTPVPSSGHEIVHKHVVKEGDTLWKLSKAWGIPLQTLIDANPQLKNPNVLVIGQVVNIPKMQSDGNVPAPNVNKPPSSKEEMTKPKSEVTKPKEEVTKPKEEVVKPKEEVTKPKEEVVKPKEEVTKPKEEVVKPKEEVTKPKEEVVKPKEEVEKPKVEITKPKVEIVEPKKEVMPQTKVPQPNEENKQVNELKPIQEIVQPKKEVKKPHHATEFVYEMEKVDYGSTQHAHPWAGYNQPINYPSNFDPSMGNQSFLNQPNMQQPYAAPVPSFPPSYEIPVPVMPQYVSPVQYEPCGCNHIASNWYPTNIQPNIEPYVQSDIQPNIYPNVQPNIQPNIEPYVQSDIQPNIYPNVQPNIQPNIEPYVQPNIQPNIYPNVQPNIQPNIEPYVQSNIQPNVSPITESKQPFSPYECYCPPTPVFCNPGFPPVPTAIYPPYPPVYGGAVSTVPGYIPSAIPAAVPTAVWGPIAQPFVYACGCGEEHGKHPYANQSLMNAANMYAPAGTQGNDSYEQPTGYGSDGMHFYNPNLYGSIPGFANSSLGSNASIGAGGHGKREEHEVEFNRESASTTDKEGHVSSVGTKKEQQARIKGSPSRTTKKKSTGKKKTAQKRSNVNSRSIPWING